MKKALLTLMCLSAMMAAGTGLKAQEVTIVLNPGWNWISCPMMDTLDFETALGSFTPAAGDIIKSRWGQAIYTNGHWMGSISQFFPGYGYHYKSNRTMPVLVTFNAQQPAPQVIVTTSEPTDITTNSATCGGNVTSSSGDYVFVFSRGICWGTSPNPAFNDNYIEAGNGLGNFNVSMTELTPGTTYYVRAFAVTANGTFYGNEISFTPDHTYVDLGLPSGTLWATCNVGAETPEDYGDYFAWGETQPKDTYNWSTYQYCMGSGNTLTKYCTKSSYGYNCFIDNLTTVLPQDDAATVNWGTGWRMPTREQWVELKQNTTYTWTTQNGVNGRLFTASNGNSLFLPAAGAGSYGNYWSSSLYTPSPKNAYRFFFDSEDYDFDECDRYYDAPVRPVRSPSQNTFFNINIIANPENGGEISGGGSYQEGAECILTAMTNEGYTFNNWAESGRVLSINPTYTFIVNADRNIVANFTSNGNGNIPTGTVDGLFSVSASQHVYFSQGNLQYQASTNTWRFAENQWDYVGNDSLGTVFENDVKCDNSLISSSYEGWIDLFGWGTSGYHIVYDNSNVNYQPWATSTSISSNYYNAYGYGPSTYHTWLSDLTGNSANCDWGVYNPIINGGNTPNQWRTLTTQEWQYILDSRLTTSGIRYAKAKVNSVNGVILLPDNWNSNTYNLSNTNSNSATYDSNILTISQWTILENAGAVFLPASGWRDDTLVMTGSVSYWSASHYDAFAAYILHCESYYSWVAARCYGLSVRLVTDFEN